jgi:4-oxalocrotonate tautomerase
MPHVIVKLWPGKSDDQKRRLTDAIVRDVTSILNYGEESVSVAFDEVSARDWKAKVYDPDIAGGRGELTKEPGYDASDLP